MTSYKIFKINFLLTSAFLFMSPGIAAAGNVFNQGETIHYNIIKTGLKFGEAELKFAGEEELNGQRLLLITLEAKGFSFYDKEMIYVDPATFLPVTVKRDLNIGGKKENITENYFAGENRVEIIHEPNSESRLELKKTAPIENIYGFIFRYRNSGEFEIGQKVAITLPTVEVNLVLKDKRYIGVAGKKYNAYFVQGSPKNIRIWFDDSPKKIPLRIDGTFGVGSTALIMTGYQEQ